MAQMYNWFLGDPWLVGKDVREVDRQAASMVLKRDPEAREYAMANREFLGRAVGYLAGTAGIDQFLDLGTGIPNMGNVHEVAQRCRPLARTVYVDHDPVVAVRGRALLATDDRTHLLELDVRDPEKIVAACVDGGLLDLSRPVGLLAVAVLHFLKTEDRPHTIIRALMDALPSGSYLVLTHVLCAPETIAGASAYGKISAPVVLRPEGAVRRFFSYAGARLVDPGLVPLPLWRPTERTGHRERAEAMAYLGGVGRRP